MKMPCLYRGAMLVAGLMTVLALLAPQGLAQARRSTVPPPPSAPGVAQGKITIKKIDGLGTSARIKTPEYTVTINDNNNPVARDWARVMVRFDTEADWTDEMVIHYYVQVHNQKTGKDLQFTGDFAYIDIPKGRNHLSTAFLRPATLERYGDIAGIAVEIEVKVEKVAVASSPETPSNWWLLTQAPKVAGVLLERSQTPFALVAYDAYVTEKPK
jgi:hypothetical protein